ncbi:hypothetical protein [Microbispora rosea]|uniref:hypothetical protein n=1 Tax=Microbispora rosea TaxID=58117 RepID=UPI0004C38098|nr:hypothetical protein [Microbispora rosea]
MVFRPAVMQTPAIVTLVVWLSRLVAGLVRLVVRHPVAVAVPVAFGDLLARVLERGHDPAR